MHSTLEVVIYLAVVAAFCFAFGYIASAIITGVREREDSLQLAERADVNGRQLIVIARGLRDTPVSRAHRADLDRWANDLEEVAVAHLGCINAIRLESLSRVGYDEPWLGEFVAQRDGERALSPRARDGGAG